MKTFIKWQGNKSKHINKFIKYIPEFTGTYIEPFVGSGALLLKLQPKKWIINDLNKDLINIWNQVKNNPKDIIKIFTEFGNKFKKLSKSNQLLDCRNITSKIEYMPYDIKRASVYMLMKFCVYMGDIIIYNKFYFNGLDLPIVINNRYFFLEQASYNNIIECSKFLNKSNGKIFNTSYEKILNKAKKNDFVFLDPPYIETHDYKFNYNKNEVLDESFINNLYQQVKKLDTKDVKWLMTQADTKQVKDIFKEYTIKKIKVYRMASKSYVNELVIMNYNI
jgi:DNA adenine methylase